MFTNIAVDNWNIYMQHVKEIEEEMRKANKIHMYILVHHVIIWHDESLSSREVLNINGLASFSWGTRKCQAMLSFHLVICDMSIVLVYHHQKLALSFNLLSVLTLYFIVACAILHSVHVSWAVEQACGNSIAITGMVSKSCKLISE
jgi:hypothetical protein